MNDENDSLIGFDPLAWMKEEEGENPAAPAEAAPAPAQSPVGAEVNAEPLQAETPVAEPPLAADDSPADDGVVALGEILDIAHVAALYEQLNQALSGGREPALDGTQLERVDAAGLQLLAAYSRELRDHGGSIRWQGEPAAALRDAAGLLDLRETLGLAA